MIRSPGLILLFTLGAALVVTRPSASDTAPRLGVRRVTDEAEAVLAALERRARGEGLSEELWQTLTATEGYRRLRERDTSYGVEHFDETFRDFLLSDELLARRERLARAVAAWKTLDLTSAADRALAYLPAGTRLEATLYPVIKPRSNSFVFDLEEDPAIFFYVDPDQPRAELENHLAHELHHIGYGTGCTDPSDDDRLQPGPRAALRWLGGFGEGLATLAAAGGPDVHPHATSDPEDWAVWERDVARFDEDLSKVEAFLLAVARGEMSDDEQRKGFLALVTSPGVPQGPMYTVGWKMAALVERVEGRDALVAGICDPRDLLTAYNRVAERLAEEHRRSDGGELPRWSEGLLARWTTGAK